jgi:hypothetical protein
MRNVFVLGVYLATAATTVSAQAPANIESELIKIGMFSLDTSNQIVAKPVLDFVKKSK